MTYPEGFFSNMRFKIHELPEDTDLFQEFPVLNNFKSFKVPFLLYENAELTYDRNEMLRYVFYCYDMSIEWDVPDVKTKKERAGKLAGITTNIIKMLVANKIPEVNYMIIDFLKIQNNRTFTWKVNTEEVIDEYYSLIRDPIDTTADDEKKLKAAEKKTKLLNDCKMLGKELDDIDKEFFGSVEEAAEIEQITPISPQDLSKLKT